MAVGDQRLIWLDGAMPPVSGVCSSRPCFCDLHGCWQRCLPPCSAGMSDDVKRTLRIEYLLYEVTCCQHRCLHMSSIGPSCQALSLLTAPLAQPARPRMCLPHLPFHVCTSLTVDPQSRRCAVTVKDVLARYEMGETVGVGGAAVT
jgi:hypothetical protein